jgi:hypothetical protein
MPRPRSIPGQWFSRLVSPLLSPAWQPALVLAALLAVVTAGAARYGESGAGSIGGGTRLFATEPHSVDPSYPLPISARTIVTSADQCYLTTAQERDAVSKFDKMWPVLRHPRCVNCHGGVNPYVDERTGKHLGGKIIKGNGLEETMEKCQECHGELPGWDIPVSSMFFVGKSSRQLCNLFKKTFPSGERFDRHIANDNGGVQFTFQAFEGDRGLDEHGQAVSEASTGRPFQKEKPPMTHGEMIEFTRAWTAAVGQGWRVTDCGCRVHSSTWTGTIIGEWDFQAGGDMGHIRETTRANVRYELDSSLTDEAATRWKSTSGLIEWSSNISGSRCTASASGTVPVGLGSDLNPMGGISMENSGQGPYRFTVSIGPWPDQYEADFAITCKDAPPLPGLLYGGGIWWGHPPAGMLSPDGKTLVGSYQTANPLGTTRWTWDLQLDEADDAGSAN